MAIFGLKYEERGKIIHCAKVAINYWLIRQCRRALSSPKKLQWCPFSRWFHELQLKLAPLQLTERSAACN